VTPESDIDLLAIVEGPDTRFDPRRFSIYSLGRLRELWMEGNPFSWHLHSESRVLYSSNGVDVLKSLGVPAAYAAAEIDCFKFHSLFHDALESFVKSPGSRIFDLSVMFLSLRNFATCYQLGVSRVSDFSRDSARHMGENRVPISDAAHILLLRSRLLATRGFGAYLTNEDTQGFEAELYQISEWMRRLRYDAFGSSGVQ
jgi:hypothetical protein